MKRSLKLEITAIILLLTLILLGSYVVFIKAPTTLITDSYTISDTSIPHEFNGFKIGLFSDTCIRNENDIELLEETVEKLKTDVSGTRSVLVGINLPMIFLIIPLQEHYDLHYIHMI